jgi:hypothetical protein
MQPRALAPADFNLPDAMAKITAETKKRGVKIIPWMEEDNRILHWLSPLPVLRSSPNKTVILSGVRHMCRTQSKDLRFDRTVT